MDSSVNRSLNEKQYVYLYRLSVSTLKEVEVTTRVRVGWVGELDNYSGPHSLIFFCARI